MITCTASFLVFWYLLRDIPSNRMYKFIAPYFFFFFFFIILYLKTTTSSVSQLSPDFAVLWITNSYSGTGFGRHSPATCRSLLVRSEIALSLSEYVKHGTVDFVRLHGEWHWRRHRRVQSPRSNFTCHGFIEDHYSARTIRSKVFSFRGRISESLFESLMIAWASRTLASVFENVSSCDRLKTHESNSTFRIVA